MDLLAPVGPSLFHRSDQVRATFLIGAEPSLVVSFLGVGSENQTAPSEEFVASASQDGRNHVLFVADIRRSWYNDPAVYEEVLDLIESYKRLHHIKQVVTFGNSMGGYGAVLFAGAIGAQQCFAISPQYSADPKVVPEEARWPEYRDRIAQFTRPPLETVLSDTCHYFVLHGGAAQERPHSSRFPKAANVHHYVAPSAGHGLVKKIKEAGLLKTVCAHAALGRRLAFRKTLKSVFPDLKWLT